MDQENRTQECIIASMDLLGMKRVILHDSDDDHLCRIQKLYKGSINVKNGFYYKEIKIRFFSDNVVLLIDKDAYQAADRLCRFLAFMCKIMLENGYKPRGGICLGRMYIDDVFVWGSGLVQAYHIESVKAKYPRIIVDSEVVKCLSDGVLRNMIAIDPRDGLMYLNYIQNFGDTPDGQRELIDKTREWLVPEMEREKQNPQDHENYDNKTSVLEKLEWLKEYLDLEYSKI